MSVNISIYLIFRIKIISDSYNSLFKKKKIRARKSKKKKKKTQLLHNTIIKYN
jgi:lysozyme family protein